MIFFFKRLRDNFDKDHLQHFEKLTDVYRIKKHSPLSAKPSEMINNVPRNNVFWGVCRALAHREGFHVHKNVSKLISEKNILSKVIGNRNNTSKTFS